MNNERKLIIIVVCSSSSTEHIFTSEVPISIGDRWLRWKKWESLWKIVRNWLKTWEKYLTHIGLSEEKVLPFRTSIYTSFFEASKDRMSCCCKGRFWQYVSAASSYLLKKWNNWDTSFRWPPSLSTEINAANPLTVSNDDDSNIAMYLSSSPAQLCPGSVRIIRSSINNVTAMVQF